MLQKAGRHREERRDSYPPGKPTSNANCQFRRVRVSWEVSIMLVELQRQREPSLSLTSSLDVDNL